MKSNKRQSNLLQMHRGFRGDDMEGGDTVFKHWPEIENSYHRRFVTDFVNQYPEPGMKVKPGRKVYVTVVSNSYEKVPLPDLTDVTLRAATLQLQAYGFQIGRIEQVPSIGQTVIAIKQNGREIPWGTYLKKGSVVDIVIGSGMQEDIDTLQTNTEDDEQAQIISTVSKRLGI